MEAEHKFSSMTAEHPQGGKFNWRRKKKPKHASNTDEQLYTTEEVLAEVKALYPHLRNNSIFEGFKTYVDTMITMYGVDEVIFKNKVNIHALYAKYARLKLVGQNDANKDEWLLKSKNGRTLHASVGHVSMEPAVHRTPGKAVTYKENTVDDAYNFALMALHDHSFHPPNKIRLNNMDRAFQLKVQKALAQISKECLPPGKAFIVANPVVGVAPRMRFDKILYCSKDDIHDVAPDTQQTGTQTQTQSTSSGENRQTRGQRIAEEAGMRKQPYSKQYNDLNQEERFYNTAKSLLLKHPEDYKGDVVTQLASDLEKAYPNATLEVATLEKILKRLKGEHVVEIDDATAIRKFTEVMSAPIKRDDPDYNKVAASMVHEPGKWVGKQRKDVSDFLFGKHTDLSQDQRKILTNVWDTLKADKIVTVDKLKIVSVASVFAGTDIGADFIKASTKPAEPVMMKILARVGDEIRVRGTHGLVKAAKGTAKLAVKANDWFMDTATAYATRIAAEAEEAKKTGAAPVLPAVAATGAGPTGGTTPP